MLRFLALRLLRSRLLLRLTTTILHWWRKLSGLKQAGDTQDVTGNPMKITAEIKGVQILVTWLSDVSNQFDRIVDSHADSDPERGAWVVLLLWCRALLCLIGGLVIALLLRRGLTLVAVLRWL